MNLFPLGPPLALDPLLVEAGLRRWHALAATTGDPELAAFIRAAPDLPRWGPILRAVFAGSPFLTDCLLAEPDLVRRLNEDGVAATRDFVFAELASLDPSERGRLASGLRRARRKIALLVGLADLAGALALEETSETLTAFADAALSKAVRHLLLDGVRRGELGPLDPEDPERGSGLVVLGMGKYGARELNYSSDVDLIVLFEDGKLPCRASDGPMAAATRLARSLVHLLEQPTRDGYVFRIDLRLRPHLPGHPLVISTEAAEAYYERHGQNWERAAFIKARAAAGDRAAGERFLRRLVPYVWRRSLDFAAIRDIHSIKRQIHAHRGFGAIRVLGHDIKVGRGGIREIEFFAQTQQLILGGRDRDLRSPRTCEALRALADKRWIAPRAAEELVGAYRFLRCLEHRLQMVADKQTQTIPVREQEVARFAAFAGFPSPEAMIARVLAELQTVERHYAALFEREPDLGAGGSLVFTGTEDDPGTLQTLATMGFREPQAVAARIRSWHHGHIRATRSTRARELLTELTPALLQALSRQADPDLAFKLFDEFVSALPAGVQLFSLLVANPRLLDLLADLMGAAPRLARHLATQSDLFEQLIQPDFFEPLPRAESLSAELAARLGDARDLQDTLELAARWARGRQFQAGVQVLLGIASAEEAAEALTAIAETVLRALLPRAEAWLEPQHGRIPGGAFVVLGFGKLGSRELTVGSDLDLVFVYDAPEGARSDGPKPLDAASWYARLGNRLVAAITARTAGGQLYEIDTRLRPSGNVGPPACALANFERYQMETAEVWEQQALTRARVVAGDPELGRRVEEVIARAVRRPRDRETLARAVRAMRERIWREHGREDPWAVKHARGGLVDLEFAAQFLVLAHAAEHPELHRTATLSVLETAGELGVLAPHTAREAAAALKLLHALQAVLRLSTSARFDPATAPPGLKHALLAAARRALPDEPLPDFAALERRLVEAEAAARQLFDELCPPSGTSDDPRRRG
ncbi:MAG: bifunctional [glutamine synthetase] adenylyltransferase/[glutamine synthetase]-adenylyl-L-tyrosine phosphorylase [Geminicoccaceae bacterium]|nr:bifunctional [glutamine synthetase] adenylyltransferase/[glutamine synthetase]-adenylyl-L-tyrosine phosphorylase [Geminicoccaceae bacterium]MDW8340915.1 bifunctional [glutamine synthetase] adenylyltransferase/[glutamine synthetase]-adenylyl-L-tyrosine phosphorylase [Geminicoccaceae bacterium]